MKKLGDFPLTLNPKLKPKIYPTNLSSCSLFTAVYPHCHMKVISELYPVGMVLIHLVLGRLGKVPGKHMKFVTMCSQQVIPSIICLELK